MSSTSPLSFPVFRSSLSAPGFINVDFPFEAVTADVPRAATKVPLSAALHALVPLQLITRMKGPTQHLAVTATFASCQIGETWPGKISQRLGQFEVIRL